MKDKIVHSIQIDQSKYELIGNLAIYKGGKQQFYNLTETIPPYYEGRAAHPLIEVHQVGKKWNS